MMIRTGVTLCALAVIALSPAPAMAKKKKDVSPPTDMIYFAPADYRMANDEKSGGSADGVLVSVGGTKGYSIDKHAVTNQQFREFIRATGYKTEAENFGWSFVLEYLASEAVKSSTTQTVKGAEHWLAVQGAWWRQPEGKGSSIKQRPDHPAVHISWNDARNYCKWVRKRLPTEAEWEWAARDGRATNLYPWGDAEEGAKVAPGKMNAWQGKFPKENTERDGFAGTCPATHFGASSAGLYNMLGNVWEWTKDTFHQPPNPRGPPPEQQFVLKGGSYIDSADGSANHKITAVTRMGNTADSGGANTGFRCAKKGRFDRAAWKPRKKFKPLEPYKAPPPPPMGGRGRGRGGGGRGGMPPGMDQEMLQKIAAEKGVEGLQEFLAQSGSGARVMTPAQLQAMSERRKQMRGAMGRGEL